MDTRTHIASELIMYQVIQRWLHNITMLYIELTHMAKEYGNDNKHKEFEKLATSIENVIHRCIQQQGQIKPVM